MRVEQLTLFDLPTEPKKTTICLSISNFANILASKGFDIGEVRLFAKLREWRMIDKFNVPYSKYVTSGYFKTIRQNYFKGQVPHVFVKTLVTPNGQKYIERRLRDETVNYRS